jgi:hypothetical protein
VSDFGEGTELPADHEEQQRANFAARNYGRECHCRLIPVWALDPFLIKFFVKARAS